MSISIDDNEEIRKFLVDEEVRSWEEIPVPQRREYENLAWEISETNDILYEGGIPITLYSIRDDGIPHAYYLSRGLKEEGENVGITHLKRDEEKSIIIDEVSPFETSYGIGVDSSISTGTTTGITKIEMLDLLDEFGLDRFDIAVKNDDVGVSDYNVNQTSTKFFDMNDYLENAMPKEFNELNEEILSPSIKEIGYKSLANELGARYESEDLVIITKSEEKINAKEMENHLNDNKEDGSITVLPIEFGPSNYIFGLQNRKAIKKIKKSDITLFFKDKIKEDIGFGEEIKRLSKRLDNIGTREDERRTLSRVDYSGLSDFSFISKGRTVKEYYDLGELNRQVREIKSN